MEAQGLFSKEKIYEIYYSNYKLEIILEGLNMI